ncbi:hypothetical protein CEP45_02545 [Mergibacter septicus]|uniref:UPF0231 family protein n=1 Tax=Mergibacter septicus TaxID=221402 RepID=UPI001C77502E|nr:YacL family protein [Mergibacter septicus]QDJ12787.1 hypothetical protein CEP45_02545 [Mergibacter septicus]
MEYQFLSDRYTKVNVKCSMEHQAIAHWINTEIHGDLTKLEQVIDLIQQSKIHHTKEHQFLGREYSLFLSQMEVIVKANGLMEDENLDEINEILDEGLHLYDEESFAICGLDDFYHFILAYQQFLQA